MALDIESLLAPVSEDDPVGPDLDYDPGRDTIRAVFETGFSDEDGGGDVSWRDIIAERNRNIHNKVKTNITDYI